MHQPWNCLLAGLNQLAYCFKGRIAVSTIANSAHLLENEDFPYRSISRLAVVSLVLMVIATLGLLPSFEPILAAAAIGMVLAWAALVRIRAYPAEYAGLGLAIAGFALNGAVLLGGVSEHTYIYLTEVPPGFQRVSFPDFESPKNFADLPTPKALEANGKQIFLKGYVHPSSGDGQLRHFVIVPDLGTCCFGGDPNSTSMIEVTLTGTQTIRYQMRKYKLAGRFQVDAYARPIEGFKNTLFYKLRAEQAK